MEFTEAEKKYREKKLKIRSKLCVGKDTTVSTGKGSYQARSIRAVLDAVLPELKANNIDYSCIKIHTEDAGPTHFKAVFTYRFFDLDNMVYEDVEAAGGGSDRSDKDTGKAQTYALKYIFVNMFGLDSGEDPDYDSSDMDAEQSLTHLQNLMKELKSVGYFTSPMVNPEGSQEVAKSVWAAMGSEIEKHINNVPWLMKREDELSALLNQLKAAK